MKKSFLNDKYLLATISLMFIIAFHSSVSGRNNAENLVDKRQADWIWQVEDGPKNSWIAFRKEVEIQSKPAQAMATIAAESKYWLWINGKMVVFEGQLKRDRLNKTYFDEVDIAPFLKKGKNTIAVLVWYWGREGFAHHDIGKGGLLFDAGIKYKSLNSNTGWKVKAHPGFEQSTGGGQPNFRLSEWNVRFNAVANNIDGWQMPDYDDADWNFATVKKMPSATSPENLLKRPFPKWFDSGLLNYVSKSVISKKDKNIVVEGKLPYDARISAYLKVKAPAGKLINIQTDQYDGWYAFGDGPAVRAEYITREGVQEFETMVWMSGNTVQYSLPEGVEIISLKYRELTYPATFKGSFHSNDPFYDKLWTMARRTLYINMFDNFMDCPDRERALWWGDVVNQSGEVFYTLDTTSHALIKKSIYTLTDWQRADNTLFSPTSTKWDAELPLQMLASIGWYGFWNYYMNTNDTTTIKDAYPAVRKYLSIWKMGENGLVMHRKGAWDWGDWGTNIDFDILDNAWYYLALKAAIPMSEISGCASDSTDYAERMRSIESNFSKVFWKEGEQHFRSASLKVPDDRANAMAVIAGLAGPHHYDGVRKVLIDKSFASPYMEKYVLEALCKMGSDSLALVRMKNRYAEMVNHPTYNTLWEVWSGLREGTINHGWNAPNTVLSQNIAGISPVKPGWKTYEVLPKLGGLKEVSQTVPTIKGLIKVHHSISEKSFIISLESPKHTTAIVGIPVKYPFTSIYANGAIIWRDGHFILPNNGVQFYSSDNQYIKFSFRPGKWKITYK